MDGKRRDPKKAWEILKVVDEQLHEQEDSKGDLKDNGEARGLQHMHNVLQQEIAKNATDFLKQHGFTKNGQRRKKGQR